jgi:Lon protease-like protein
VASIPAVIPLFPLPDVVLFPQVALPLHVFEPRYRKLVADALAGERVIGMSLLRAGWEHDYYGRPPLYEQGCAGRIEQHEALPDGRSNIVLRGLTRFRIVEEHAGEPYRLARVVALPDAPGEAAEVEAARRELMAAIGRAADGPQVLVIKPDVAHDVFVNALSQALPLTGVERQSLLECDGVLERYRRLASILEFRWLEQQRRGPSEPSVH